MDALTAEDKLAICELFSRYAWGMDRVDRNAFEGIWAPDAVWTAEGVSIHCEGLPAIMDYFDRTAVGRVATPGVGSSVRLFSTPIITSAGPDVATSKSELAAFKLTATAIVAYSVGYYEDKVVRVDGQWRIGVRKMIVNPPM